jgi:L-fucose mutarotase/ribose pyranase (RbsD/FucU family)
MGHGDSLVIADANYPSDHLMLCCDVALVVSGSGLLTRQTAQRKTSQRNSRMH